MYRVDISGDLNDGDDTGYIWTFLARHATRMASCLARWWWPATYTPPLSQVVTWSLRATGPPLTLRPLPGLVEGFIVVARRLVSLRASTAPVGRR